MEKDITFETAKNMAIEQVLNMYCSPDDPNRPASKPTIRTFAKLHHAVRTKNLPRKNQNDKGNGFYKRMLATSVGNLKLSVPRTRASNLFSSILPQPYKKAEPSYSDFLMSSSC